MKETFISTTEEETKKVARDFAKSLKGGEVILLTGELGAGKTVFVKAVAESLGVIRNVSSPTFVLMQIYKTSNKKIKNLCHMDVYRLDSAQDFMQSGLEEYLFEKDTVCFIEWGEKIKKMLKKYIHVKIKVQKDKRKIEIKYV